VVNVVSDCFSDLGAEDGDEFIQFAFMTSAPLPLQKRGELNYNDISAKFEPLKIVRGITVNTVHGNEKSIEKVKKQFNPDIESMEGAAFFYCCLNEDIPCLQIRSISNYIERRNKAIWEIDLAINKLSDFLLKLLSN
jgi:futalosine hydrolase